MSNWLFDPDGTLLEGPQGPVSHLICGGVYDWSTGLIFKGGRYFDPNLGIWLALMPLMMIQLWCGHRMKRRRWLWYVSVLVVVGIGGMLVGCGSGSGTGGAPVCTSYTGNPRSPGPHDADILDASVIIQPVIGGTAQPRSLGTIVGRDGADWVIYTHHHFNQGNALGVHLSDSAITDIIVYSYNGINQVTLNKVGSAPNIRVDNVTGERTSLKANMAMLDGSAGFPRIGKPITKIDGAAVSVGDQVDIAYFGPAGNTNTQVEIWHTSIINTPGLAPGLVAVLGAPAPGDAFGPGGHGDSGGGLFRNGVHIGNTLNWIHMDIKNKTSGVVTGHRCDSHWRSFLNP